jgi:hypothetical protein
MPMSTPALIARENRLTLILGVGVMAAVAGLEAVQFEAPAYKNEFAAVFVISLFVGIGMYWMKEWTSAVGPQHVDAVIVGQEVPVDLFFVRGTDPSESQPIEAICLNPDCDYEWNNTMDEVTRCPTCEEKGIWSTLSTTRYETCLNLVYPEFFDAFPEVMSPYYVYIRHWLLWDERYKAHWGIALKGGIPYGHPHSDTLVLKPLDVEAFIGPDGFGIYATFNLVATIGGDASVDMEFIDQAWRSHIKATRKGNPRPQGNSRTLPAVPSTSEQDVKKEEEVVVSN